MNKREIEIENQRLQKKLLNIESGLSNYTYLKTVYGQKKTGFSLFKGNMTTYSSDKYKKKITKKQMIKIKKKTIKTIKK